MNRLKEFVNHSISGHPFDRWLDSCKPSFLVGSQALGSGLIFLGNCFRVQLVALKAFFAFGSVCLIVTGLDRIFTCLNELNVLKYPTSISSCLQRLTEAVFSRINFISMDVKAHLLVFTLMTIMSYTIAFTLASVLFSFSSLSAFSIVLLLLWASSYLFFDFNCIYEFFKISDSQRWFIENLLLCLNILMAIWFVGFLTVPLVPN
ncbi:hypothetical protein [Candidatus Similichlamydia epinepheli]|uniref:hypothetical protein n=1 Tax=Candidatus Similichlamydia epinepheli TaxID=1903953 RepID=UPI000D3423ED|nr:hypothetical protein [Candidatus Similichlamydia epinepheli]